MENSKDFTNTENNINKIPTKPSEYRPISVFPVLSKVFERIILNQVKEFIDKHEVYQSTQSGHRKGNSCITVLLNLIIFNVLLIVVK